MQFNTRQEKFAMQIMPTSFYVIRNHQTNDGPKGMSALIKLVNLIK